MEFLTVRPVRIIQPIRPRNAILHDNEKGARQRIRMLKASCRNRRPLAETTLRQTLFLRRWRKTQTTEVDKLPQAALSVLRSAVLPDEYRYWPA